MNTLTYPVAGCDVAMDELDYAILNKTGTFTAAATRTDQESLCKLARDFARIGVQRSKLTTCSNATD